MAKPKGKVYLVGAGPGHPGLLTLRGADLLRRADLVLYDRLVPKGILDLAPASAKRIDVGKGPKGGAGSQGGINDTMIREARRGRTVVRLKGGDPVVFGRGGEEAEALHRAGVAFEIVPGVSAATAVPGSVGIPLTHRDLASTVVIATGHEGEDKAGRPVDWKALGGLGATVVILMGVAQAEGNIRRLMEGGLRAGTPAAVVERGTTTDQRIIVGVVGDIARRAREANVQPPALFILGDVVALRDRLGSP